MSARDVVANALENTPEGQSEWGHIGRAEQILAALHAAGYVIERDWQPIETAPRDGTEVLVWAPSFASAYEGYFEGGSWWVSDSLVCDPTHWRPLPTPSKETPDAP